MTAFADQTVKTVIGPRSCRALMLVVVAATVLAACNRPRETQSAAPTAPVATAPTVPVAPTAASTPLKYESKTPYSEVTLTLPDAIKTQPELQARLYTVDVADLQKFNEGAQADLTEAGGQEMRPYERIIRYQDPVQTDRLFSLSRSAWEDTGGAHGNGVSAGVLWDRTLKRPVMMDTLFAKGADLTVLDRALCAAVNAAKKARDPQAERITLDTGTLDTGKPDQTWACPRVAQTAYVLTPGTVPGKAGGLTFLIDPYQVGPYAEGAYEIDLPQSVVRPLLSPAYADQFAGAPVKRIDD